MTYEEIKPIFDRIQAKVLEIERLNKVKILVDERTEKGLITIKFEGHEMQVSPQDFKNLIDKKITENNPTADFAELKLKAK